MVAARRARHAGIIEPTRYSDRPARYSYRLSEQGRALGPVVDALADWGVAHLPDTRRREAAPTRALGTPPAKSGRLRPSGSAQPQ
ncbi:winged helix-turn-helix transcriptional regulator [Ornithinimicrobium cavernae]|uniref:winged helix-turn-helix transcriptional regulator n=1 Tax=Ornithinimicrobium cavernae TaxID=2666047 RepID=UPI00192A4B73